MPDRIAIGTVQFGLRYGIANETGQVSEAEAGSILATARTAGVDTLDTAIAYGESERRLGQVGVGGWRVVTKLPPVPKDEPRVAHWAREQVQGSLARLRMDRVTGLLLHRSADLLEGERGAELYRVMRELRERGVVEKVGVSIYDPAELDALAPFTIDIVQAPFNVMDRRLAASGWLARLKDRGVEVHTRSAFLQGLLLMAPAKRPARFGKWAPLWQRWDGWLRESGHTALEAALGFALDTAEIDRVVVGVDSTAQLREVLAAAKARARDVPAALATNDLDLISPVNWSKA